MKNTIVWSKKLDFNDLLNALDTEGNGFLVVIDSNNKFIGIVTDGDVRRSILNKRTDNLINVINTNPHFERNTKTRSEILFQLKSSKLKFIPVLNKNDELVEIITAEYIDYYDNYVVIMAGGMGTRLGNLTKNTPKPMLKVGDSPLLKNILFNCKAQGFNKFIFCVNYKSEIIKNYFEDGKKFGVEIKYTEEKIRMGTAGALSLIKNEIKNPIIVMNGDILTSVDLGSMIKFHTNNNSQATMLAKKIDFRVPYATLELDSKNNIKSLSEKPNNQYFINAGIYIFEPELIKLVPKNQFYDMTTFIDSLIHLNKKVIAYNSIEYWLDIGKKDDFNKANNDVKVDS